MRSTWELVLERWTAAGLVDSLAAERIRQWERSHSPGGIPNRLAAIAFGFGGLMLVAAAFLFVAAHWDVMSPGARFAVTLATVAVFHLGGAWSARRSPSLSTSLHATGTAALGAGIFLSGQIFNMSEHWPGALMLWSLGAGLSLALLRDWPHVLWVAVLVPSWLWGEWSEEFDRSSNLWHNAAPIVGAVLVACTYLSAAVKDEGSVARKSLSRLGALALIPACIMLGEATDAWLLRPPMKSPALGAADALAWIIAIGLPFGLALALRGGRAIYLLAVLVWCLVTVQFHWGGGFNDAGLYGSFALGAMGLAVWGVREQRQEIVNLGVLSFALTTLAFYFSSVMDKLERSLSLFLGGLLFLQGGWCLEGIRRRLISSIRQGNS